MEAIPPVLGFAVSQFWMCPTSVSWVRPRSTRSILSVGLGSWICLSATPPQATSLPVRSWTFSPHSLLSGPGSAAKPLSRRIPDPLPVQTDTSGVH